MGHINAALEWLIQTVNNIWPLIIGTFVGAWLAFQHIKHYEKRKELERRNRAGQFAHFVLSSQHDRLKSLKSEVLEPFRDHARRAILLDSTVIHDDFPKLHMATLPAAFDRSGFTLMNEVISAEQNFLEVTRLLKQRVQRLEELEHQDQLNPEEKTEKRAALKKSLTTITDKIYFLADSLVETYNALLPHLEEYFIRSEQDNKNKDLVDYFAWVFLSAACAVAGIFFFSHWAVNSTTLVRMGLDISLVSALVFATSLYASLGLCLIVCIMSLYSMVKRLRSFSIYFWTLVISLQPSLFLLWLDVT